MRGYVAPTDHGWYQFLRARPELREVNFWRPSQSRFAALATGELFFFKLKAPHNAIGGFGLFTRAAVLPVWEAWDVFGTANGVADMTELVDRLSRLTGGATRVTVDDWIGCLAINEPIFFPPDAWVPIPMDWNRQIVSGKGYDLGQGEGRRLYEGCLERASALSAAEDWTKEALHESRRGAPQTIRPRLGQASFRLAVLEAYDKRCAVTGERSLPVVEASHIRPFAAGGPHEVSNGLPLRRDIHRLFDLGFVTVRSDLTFTVSGSLRRDWKNGRAYYGLQGRGIGVPADEAARPDPEHLKWHQDEIFRS
ncbi:MAG: HNH endonuclease [Solirubrobacterales bacterium]